MLESTSGYWRIWYYLAEAAGLEVWRANARDVKHLPGRSKTVAGLRVAVRAERMGMLRRSFGAAAGARPRPAGADPAAGEPDP